MKGGVVVPGDEVDREHGRWRRARGCRFCQSSGLSTMTFIMASFYAGRLGEGGGGERQRERREDSGR